MIDITVDERGNSMNSIKCPRCSMISYNKNDIKEKYCGNCHMFHEHMVETLKEYNQEQQEKLHGVYHPDQLLDGQKRKHLTDEEMITLYNILKNQYIDYDNTPAMELVAKITRIVNHDLREKMKNTDELDTKGR